MRHIRVPRGTAIEFDKATQKFEIPPNTRFYKTFFKQVVDIDGNATLPQDGDAPDRLARPTTIDPDGTAEQNALFGTYVWNDDETEATLLNDPLRDGKPFADRHRPRT